MKIDNVNSENSSNSTTKENVFLWNVLAFQAGTLNAGGFLACHRFVSHVTGFSTMFGTEVARGRYTQAIGFLSVPAFFLLGSMIASIFIDQRIQQEKQPLYHITFGLLTLVTGLVLILGVVGFFGEFGAPLAFGQDYSLLILLCLASGLQNATVISAYGAVVRTTHLTGLTTDLGIGLVRLASSVLNSRSARREFKATIMRISIIVSFAWGSVVSAAFYFRSEYWGFVIPFCISLGLWLLSLAFRPKKG